LHLYFSKALTLSINISNIFDEIALTEILDSSLNAISSPGTSSEELNVIRSRTYPGRFSTISLEYTF